MKIKSESQELTIIFLKEIKGFKEEKRKIKCNPNYKVSVLSDMMGLLNGGLERSRILLAMNQYKNTFKDYDKVYGILDILNTLEVDYKLKEYVEKEGELIELNKFYYHPMLQVSPKPPKLTQTDEGDFVYEEEEEFFLEMKESFTMEDLVNYYYKKFNLVGNDSIRKRDMSIFSKLIDSYGLDLLLFMIDQTCYQIMDTGSRKPSTPFTLQNYIEDSMELYDNKKQRSFEGGLTHVIFREHK